MKQELSFKESFLIHQEFTESIDVSRINELLNCEIKWDIEDAIRIKSLRKRLKGTNILQVRYHHSQTNNFGRIYGNGMQSVPGIVRRYLTFDKYIDIDIVNCMPTILEQLCKKHRVSCKYLTKFVNNRDKYFDKFKTTRKTTKELFNSIINGGSIANWIEKYNYTGSIPNDIYKLETEMIRIRGYYYFHNPSLHSSLKKGSKSVLSWIIGEIEKDILELVFTKFKNDKLIDKSNNCILIHDGLMIPINNKI